jgi:glycosyltransferase involved in cell wall biosynthesis
MRVLVVSQHFWPENFRVNDLVLGLQDLGHEVTVLTGWPNYPLGDIYQDFKNERSKFSSYHGIKIHRVPVIPRKKGKGINLILNFISFAFAGLLLAPWKLTGDRFDAIFVFGNSPLTAALPAILLSKIKRVPICLWVMDLWPDTLVAMGIVKRGIQESLAKKFISFIYNNCKLVLGQSHSFVTSIKKLTKTRVEYFPSWSDVSSSTEDFPFKHGDKFNVVFAGNIGEAQDFPSILKAAELLKIKKSNVRFVIVGDGRVAPFVKNEISQKQLEEQIILLGQHPVEKMGSLFAKADALLVTLTSDPVFSKTIPGKVQAYLAAGKPILSMMDGEVFSMIKISKSGFSVKAGDYEGLANAAIQLSELPQEKLMEYSRAARTFYEQEYDRNKLMLKLEQYLSDMKN